LKRRKAVVVFQISAPVDCIKKEGFEQRGLIKKEKGEKLADEIFSYLFNFIWRAGKVQIHEVKTESSRLINLFLE